MFSRRFRTPDMETSGINSNFPLRNPPSPGPVPVVEHITLDLNLSLLILEIPLPSTT